MSQKALGQKMGTLLPRILVIEDEEDIRESFIGILEAEEYEVRGAGSIREGKASLASYRPHLLLLDLGLPDGSGLEVLNVVKESYPRCSVLVITAETKVETAVQAMRLGAHDYLEKPIGLDRLLTTVRLCLERQGLQAENLQLRQQALARHEILGKSEKILQLLDEIERVANADLPILITGENGTGKELVAQRLHLLSDRYGSIFLATNCAAVPETLIEAEFFGHVKGSFTGADRDRDGLFVEAKNGTLFLDEIGEMPRALQARLLRVLQERRVAPIGSSEERELHCRILTATNKELEDEIAAGNFRQDLYYRIRGVELRVPPLRERRDDIALLAQHFLAKAQSGQEGRIQLGAAALTWLEKQDWPGNVRQLQSLMQSAAVLLEEGEAGAEALAPLLGKSSAARSPDAAENFFGIQNIKEFLRRKLEESSWNVSQAARMIGIRRTNLHERLKHHGFK